MAGFFIVFFSQTGTIGADVGCWWIVGNINVGGIIQICIVGYLVSVAVVFYANGGQIVFGEYVMNLY